MAYGKCNPKEYQAAPKGRFGNRKIAVPGGDWRAMYGGDPRVGVHNPPKPEDGGLVGKVKKYFSKYVGGDDDKSNVGVSGYATPKKRVYKALDAADPFTKKKG